MKMPAITGTQQIRKDDKDKFRQSYTRVRKDITIAAAIESIESNIAPSARRRREESWSHPPASIRFACLPPRL